MKIKTIDITCLEWFDRVNGNSYFAAIVTANYGMKTAKELKLPFQYGYGDHYRDQAMKAMETAGWIKDVKHSTNGSSERLWQYADRHKIIVRCTKHENCKQRELKNI